MTLTMTAINGDEYDVNKVTCPRCRNFWYLPNFDGVPPDAKYCPYCGIEASELDALPG